MAGGEVEIEHALNSSRIAGISNMYFMNPGTFARFAI